MSIPLHLLPEPCEPSQAQSPRYEVHRLPNSDFILWDTLTSAQVDFAGPYQTASAATRRAVAYNHAWEAQRPIKLSDLARKDSPSA